MNSLRTFDSRHELPYPYLLDWLPYQDYQWTVSCSQWRKAIGINARHVDQSGRSLKSGEDIQISLCVAIVSPCSPKLIVFNSRTMAAIHVNIDGASFEGGGLLPPGTFRLISGMVELVLSVGIHY